MGNKKINKKNQITSLFVITLIFCCITSSFAKLRKDDDHSHPATHVANKIRTHINEHHPEMNRSEIRAHFEEMRNMNHSERREHFREHIREHIREHRNGTHEHGPRNGTHEHGPRNGTHDQEHDDEPEDDDEEEHDDDEEENNDDEAPRNGTAPLSFKMVPKMLQIKSEHILMNTTLK